jgi:molybdopterin-guanine dinucleotide biosynthesis protein A
VLEQLQQYRERLENTVEFAELTADQQQSLQVPFDRLTRELQRQRLIAVMRDSLQRFKDEVYPTLLGRMTEWAQPEDEFTYGEDEGEEKGPTVGGDEKIEYVSRTALSVAFDAPWLATEEDVEHYLEALRETLLQAIEDGKRIHI